MKLHVFNDSHGFFLNLAVARVLENGATAEHRFVNLSPKTIYPNERVTYLKKSLPAFRQYIDGLSELNEVIFYPLDSIAAHFLNLLRKKQSSVRVAWVFWGYEFYHRPEKYPGNFDAFSLNHFRKEQSILRRANDALKMLGKSVLRVPQHDRHLLDRSYAMVTDFFSFMEEDLNSIRKEKPGMKAPWHQVSFLSIKEMTAGLEPSSSLTNSIMLGHAATPTLNHFEVLEKLAAIGRPLQIFMTMEYGDPGYRQKIKEEASRLFPGRVEFLETRLALDAYYQRIALNGFAIFPFHWQEGLANLVFLVWNGTKLFLRENSAVYKQFRKWGIVVFSIEKELNEKELTAFLPETERKRNREILESILSVENVKGYWEFLVNH